MLWRMAGGGRALFGCSRRTMSGKRLVFGVLCSVCLTLGVYIRFFNHESADNLLEANRVDLQDKPVLGKPNFQHFKSHKVTEKPVGLLDEAQAEVKHNVAQDNNEQRERTFNEQEQIEQRVTQIFGEGNKEGKNNHREKSNHETDDDVEDDDAFPNDVPQGEGENAVEPDNGNERPAEVPNETRDETKNEQPHDKPNEARDEAKHEADVPIVERVEGENEEDSEVRDAGGDGGERVEEGGDGDGGGGRGGGGGGKDGRGPHGLKLFDWDQWVKDNEFVELGNVWGYCDDENPPVIGKILLLPDEESGGLKNIVIFNITTEYDIVMGRVEVSIDYNDMHFYANKFDFEDLEEDGDFFKTPILKGDHYFVMEKHLSGLIPKGHYYGEARMLDQNDKMVLCATMNLEMK